MRVHEVLIIPAAGHFGGGGPIEKGYRTAALTELDVVQGYVRGLAEELDTCSIRHQVLPTHQAPGLSNEARLRSVRNGHLVLSCRVGWFRPSSPSKNPTTNLSRVFYGAKELAPMAKRLSEAVGHWGQLYGGFGHRGSAAIADRDDPLLNVVDSWGVRIEPFALNGPGAVDYCRKLEQLGHDIGRVVTHYLMERDEARNKPSSLSTFMPPRRYGIPEG